MYHRSKELRRDLGGYGRQYPTIRWPDSSRIAVSVVVHFEEGAERTPLEGDAHPELGNQPVAGAETRRNLATESAYEYGTRRGFWRLLEILEKNDVKATFFCSGQALEKNPIAAQEITANGHEACGHGYRWLPSYEFSRQEEKVQIRRAVEAIERTTNQRTVGWNSRAPSAYTRELLVEDGSFIYDSDSYGDDLPYFVDLNGQRWLTIPYSLETNDEKYLPSPFVPAFGKPEHFFAVLKASFDRLYAEGSTHPKMMSVGLHLRHSGRPPRVRQVNDFIRYAKGFPGVWFPRRVDIARWWLEHYSHLQFGPTRTRVGQEERPGQQEGTGP